jgi:hypothetical protein
VASRGLEIVPKHPKRPRDPNQPAKLIVVDLATREALRAQPPASITSPGGDRIIDGWPTAGVGHHGAGDDLRAVRGLVRLLAARPGVAGSPLMIAGVGRHLWSLEERARVG